MLRHTQYPRRVFLDSSANLGLADVKDSHHANAIRIHERINVAKVRLVTTNYIIDESYTLIMSSLGIQLAQRFLTSLRASSIVIERGSAADEQRAEAILFQYQDKRFSYTDATSFAVMERLGLDTAFSFDRDFVQYGFRVLRP